MPLWPSCLRPRDPGLRTWVVVGVLAVLLASDRVYPALGDGLIGGGCDEVAHLLTGVLVLLALPATSERFARGLLLGSVVIDLDHIPRLLGSEWLTEGTPRPYSHSLLTLAVIAVVAFVGRRRRTFFTGLGVGVAIHFLRDLAESRAGLSLLWPWTRSAQSLPHWSYVIAVCVISLSAVRRGWHPDPLGGLGDFSSTGTSRTRGIAR